MDKLKDKVINNRYRIEDMVGIGGMAVVYRAVDLNTNTRVAVKVLKDEFLENQNFRTRFEAESKIVAMLSHDNIVKVYDVGFNDDLYYIVMEYVDGISLKQYIEQEGSLNANEATYFMVQVLKALSHAHGKGVVHRDIKPQNIMVLQNGNVKVMDFGIAKYAQSVTLTMAEHAIGSVHYISPEQVQGKKTDMRSDIYSVGVMFYEMLTGKVPFDADSPVAVAMKQVNELPVAPIELRDDIPAAINEIILKAMSKEPSARYDSAQAFLDDLLKAKANGNIIFGYDIAFKVPSSVSVDGRPTAQLDATQYTAATYLPRRPKSKKTAVILGAVACVLAIAALVLVLAGFRADVKVPNLLGGSPGELDRYSKLNIVVMGEIFSDEYGIGLICAQLPEAGITVKKDATIEVWVSKGIETVSMPQLVNTELGSAASRLTSLGLTYQSISEYSSTIPNGYVIRTEPSYGAKVAKGSTVKVIVSKGPNVTNSYSPTVTEERTLIIPISYSNESSLIAVYQDGNLIYQNLHDKERSVAISVFGTGISQFEVFVNQHCIGTYAVEFN